jgi:hypothetical protein
MDISIFGYKLNLEILILIGVVYLILVGHMFCGCCHFGMSEGFDVSGNVTKPTIKNANLPTQTTAGTSGIVDTINTLKPVPTTKEGFVGANINYGESSIYNLDSNKPVDTSAWAMPNLTVVPGQPLNPSVKAFLDREPQPVPLPEGELSMFANTPFKPECCPNTYSNSSGCACMTGQQYNYLILRGGNNVPYSEY